MAPKSSIGSPRPWNRNCAARTPNTRTGGDTRRLGPVQVLRIPPGSWAEFQKRRLAKSGGKVEQYKQPHLIPDLDQIAGFRLTTTTR